MASFEMVTRLAAPREQVFDFLIRSANVVEELTHPGSGMKIVSAPETLAQGSRIELELHGLGPVQKIAYEVTEFARPSRFVETLVKGPLKSYRHEHLLDEADGVTTVTDKVTFEPPGGLLGFVVTEDKVRQGLLTGFKYRQERLEQRFGTA